MSKIKEFNVSQNVKIVTISSKQDHCVIGYRKINRMAQVAVSYCAPDDKWKANIGRANVHDRLEGAAVYKILDGVISLPIGEWSDNDIQIVLIGMFFGFED
jgi:hypothetical protein